MLRLSIKTKPPGMNARKIIELDHRYLATSTKTSPIVAKRAEGAFVEDVDGNVYLDFTCGVGVTSTGHCHPEIVRAIKEQASQLIHFAGTDFYYDIQVRLAQKLVSITPGNFDKKVFFTNSGTEAIECAIKIARWQSDRKQFISFLGAFHGRTLGSLALTASKIVQRDRFFPLTPGVNHIPYAYCYRCPYKQTYPDCDLWCAKIIEELYFKTSLPPQEVAALFVEPVQGEGGYIFPPKEFIPELKKIADKYKILLVDDEIQAGLGRTGKMFCIEHYDIEPDIITVAKALGSGMPIGVCIFRKELDFKVKGAHSNTYGGNLVACASALATIEVIEKDGLVKNASVVGEHLKKRLLELSDKYKCIGDVRGLGLMQVTEFVEDRKTKKHAIKLRDRILKNAYEKGLILLPCGISGIRYIPPLNITRREVDMGVEILDRSIKKAIE
ncbi:MAG: acetyl ornithine aminotransferase family protein [Candidatus Thermoplasmatota archaeon]|nr:acetyl ornithine aminotransferase family protein [Candidatus Thermoplasmatota archaeon]